MKSVEEFRKQVEIEACMVISEIPFKGHHSKSIIYWELLPSDIKTKTQLRQFSLLRKYIYFTLRTHPVSCLSHRAGVIAKLYERDRSTINAAVYSMAGYILNSKQHIWVKSYFKMVEALNKNFPSFDCVSAAKYVKCNSSLQVLGPVSAHEVGKQFGLKAGAQSGAGLGSL